MISLYGSLAKKFERRYQATSKNIKINVGSAAEMLRAMEANFQGFRDLIRKKGQYHLVRGKDLESGSSVEDKELGMMFGETDWHLLPVATGSKGDYGAIIWGSLLFLGGLAGNILFPGNPLSTYMMSAGAAMVLGGVAQLLAPGPQTPESREKPEEKASYLFTGPVNQVEPGTTIPVGYGLFDVGTITVSGGLRAERI